ncbi:MAG: cyclic nucleotide-binding domain-containing protein [Richelia sp. SM1_7_0]|nr:cyclic nucleotide-binding domain-containing protein [Richelia sp. SM1_7_0]
MNKSIAEKIFSAFPFFQQLDSEIKTDLLNQAQQVKLSAGEFICLEGDFCNHLPLLISGSVRIYKIGENCREITLYHLEKGDSCILTASCIISKKAFPAFAITETEVEAMIIPANSLRKWIMQSQIWQNYIFGLLSQRLANVIEIVEEVAFRRMDSRIASYLFKSSDNCVEAIYRTETDPRTGEKPWWV